MSIVVNVINFYVGHHWVVMSIAQGAKNGLSQKGVGQEKINKLFLSRYDYFM